MESCCAITVVAVFTEQDSGIQKTYPLKREFASQCFQGIVDNTTTVQIFVNNQFVFWLFSGCCVRSADEEKRSVIVYGS